MSETKQARIFHNPRCSKSRATLALLEENSVATDIVEYLKTPPSEVELDEILSQLGLEPRDLMRKGEAEYKEAGLDNPDLDRKALIKGMVENPKVIERPIVLMNGKAVVGRPPENVLNLL